MAVSKVWILRPLSVIRKRPRNTVILTLMTKGLPIIMGLSLGLYVTMYVKQMSDRRGSRGHYYSSDPRTNAHMAEMAQLYKMRQAQIQLEEAIRNGSIVTQAPTTAPEAPEEDTDIKKILFWTVYSSSPHFYFGFGKEAFLEAHCEVYKCMTTNDRSILDDADAVVFNHNNIDMGDMPPSRRQRQVWVHINMESPANSAQLPLNGLFNMTMSYKRDSDVYMPAGWTEKMTSNQRFRHRHANYAQKKKKLAAWFVSRCTTPSMREAYVEELQRYIPVDVFGDCGPLVCEKNVAICYNMLQDDYKFYLSFENSLCREYLTEKLWRPFRYDVVPVVLGSANYSNLLPPHSYIDIRDFDSPKALADYLMKLDKNDDLYNGYMEWKKEYKIMYEFKQRFDQGFCGLCATLHNVEGTRKTLNNLEKWHSVEKDCHTTEQYYGNMIDASKWLPDPV